MNERDQLEIQRDRLIQGWQQTGEEIDELSKELIPFFSATKAIRDQLKQLGFPNPRRAELFRELDGLQFACNYCSSPDHCQKRLFRTCRSFGQLKCKLADLNIRSGQYGREIKQLEREIKEKRAKAEKSKTKKTGPNGQSNLF